jgi:XTP/dITP diphosphohydrolase
MVVDITHKYILATFNRHKVDEILKILGPRFYGPAKSSAKTNKTTRGRNKIEILCLSDFPYPPKIIENGKTFEANALKKARLVAKKYNLPAIADDSGLMVDCLHGSPGVKSARYAGPNPTRNKLCRKLLAEIKKVTACVPSVVNRKRLVVSRKLSVVSYPRAKFVCCVAIVWPGGKEKLFCGEVPGHIVNEMRGENGFGYDPVLVPDGYQKTFAQMSSSFKNRISHRAKAFARATKILSGDKISKYHH